MHTTCAYQVAMSSSLRFSLPKPSSSVHSDMPLRYKIKVGFRRGPRYALGIPRNETTYSHTISLTGRPTVWRRIGGWILRRAPIQKPVNEHLKRLQLCCARALGHCRVTADKSIRRIKHPNQIDSGAVNRNVVHK